MAERDEAPRTDAGTGMFLKNCWYVAAFSSELTDKNVLSRRILGSSVLLYRTAEAAPVALLDQCPHRLVPLSLGTRVGDAIRCGYHGMVFASDGRCTFIPGQPEIPSTAKVQTFPLVEKYGHLWIWMGTPERANERAVPEIPWAADRNWATVQGYLHIEADYRLLTDNLLDLSHETYLHGKTIGNAMEETIADYPVKVSVQEGDVVVAARQMLNIDPPPYFALIMGSSARIDRWQSAIWAAPGLNMTDTGAAPAGAGSNATHIGRVMHLLTPETERSTHYFWSVCRNHGIDDEKLSRAIANDVTRTLAEDRTMLERQQAEIDRHHQSVPRIALRVDNAPLRARRFLNSRIRREQEDSDGLAQPVRLLAQNVQSQTEG